jgi:thiol-disulfide isomerase/thioredoxin
MHLSRPSTLLAALRDPKNWRKWTFEVLILLAIVTAVTLWQNRGLPEGAAPPLVGVRTDGVAIKLADRIVGGGGTAEGRPVTNMVAASLVVFWATWCHVCKVEESNISAVARDWPVFSVAMQSGDAIEVEKHLQSRGIDLPAIVDADGSLAAAWRVRGVPAHFIIDPAGNVRFRIVGYATTWGLRTRLWWAERFPL